MIFLAFYFMISDLFTIVIVDTSRGDSSIGYAITSCERVSLTTVLSEAYR